MKNYCKRASYTKSELLQLVLNYFCHYVYALTFISIVWSFDSQAYYAIMQTEASNLIDGICYRNKKFIGIIFHEIYACLHAYIVKSTKLIRKMLNP